MSNGKKKDKGNKEISLEETYTKMEQKEHVLKLPGMYIGSIKPELTEMWIVNNDNTQIIKKDITFTPGFYKINDEIFVNARDHQIRDSTCNEIRINLDKKTGAISVFNNGNGIPVQIHKEHGIYIPEMIFGHMLTSSNYTVKGKTVGGLNGLGSKCISYNTIVQLWNGSETIAKNIKPGDELIGDDGTKRTVLKVIKGNGPMYEVTQINGDKYVVNDEHILTLHMPEHKIVFCNSNKNKFSVSWWENMQVNKKTFYVNETNDSNKIIEQIKNFCKSIPDDNVFDISIKDFIKLNYSDKKKLAGVRGQCVQWKKQDVMLKPYDLGCLLGIEYCNNDNVLKSFKLDKQLTMNQKNGYDFKTSNVFFKNTSNKHIPIEYIVNDKETRFKVLAGLIDTINTVQYDDDSISIILKAADEKLALDIVKLTRSLGLYCCLSTIYDELAYFIEICGNEIANIPTIFFNTKKYLNKNKDSKSTGFITVKPIGNDNYVGIEIDGNQRFVINDFTVTHNCANIFSKRFIIDTVDIKNKKKYVQEFADNMTKISPPVITDINKKDTPYTKITYYPDYERFGMNGLTDDIIALLKKRAYDMAACTDKKVKVYLNDELLKIKSFSDFIKMHYNKDIKLVYEEVNERWKVGVVFDQDAGENQISFVNGIWTYQGGTHVEYIMKQIITKITDHIKSQSKYKTLNVKPIQIKEHLTLFIDSVINDPEFTSQTKGELKNKVVDFGSTCDLDNAFMNQLIKTGLVDVVIKNAQFKELTSLKSTDGKKGTNLREIDKLDDAHWAGTRKSKDTRLILTEGDSASSFAKNGLSVIGREKYGVFPLRGKLLNVRNATVKQIKENTEFCNLKKIMGLKQDVVYKNVSKLRYGGIIILTDQDLDGSHIKGLLINLFQYFWPELLLIKGFMQTMSTPLIKVYHKSDRQMDKAIHQFDNVVDFDSWAKTEDINKWQVKYYKGLGTSDKYEAIDVFKDFDKRLVSFIWEMCDINGNKIVLKQTGGKNDNSDDNSDSSSDDEQSKKSKGSLDEIKKSKSLHAITLAFENTKANNRKNWLANYNKNDVLKYDKEITYSDFIDKELIHFSNADNIRSIPSMVDGLKPSQRKILHVCFERNLKTQIKVAQLASSVAEKTAYKHGETSLQDTIVGIAQNFTGSNNINLLEPKGDFGSRSGAKPASPRYIYTYLNPLTYKIFRSEDFSILNYLVDEGDVIEPDYFLPILPMILINGGQGIGTGFSTNVPQYNPVDVYNNILRKMDGKEFVKMTPWYYGFLGKIRSNGEGKYVVEGKYEISDDGKVIITEIPIKGNYCWTNDYKTFLNSLIDDEKNKDSSKKLENFISYSGTDNVHFVLNFKNCELQNMVKNDVKEVEKYLKLSANMSVSNLYLYNSDNAITNYESPIQILEDFYNFRLKMYGVRKKHHIKILQNEIEILKYKVKFIQNVIDDVIKVKEYKKKEDVVAKMIKLGFPALSKNINATDEEKSHSYATEMQLFSLTEEKRDELNKQYKDKQKELEDYNSITEIELWKRELQEFSDSHETWLAARRDRENNNSGKKAKTKINKNKEKYEKPEKIKKK